MCVNGGGLQARRCSESLLLLHLTCVFSLNAALSEEEEEEQPKKRRKTGKVRAQVATSLV